MDRRSSVVGAHRVKRPAVHRRGERGQSLLEFALALPVFCALLFGSIEMGLLYKSHAAYQEAAQEAVRVGSTVGASDQETLDELKLMLAGENLNNIQSVTVFDATLGDTVPITPDTYTTYVYSATAPSGSGGLGTFICQSTRSTGGTLPCPSRAASGTPYSSWDTATTPSIRNTTVGQLDRIGIQIVYKYKSVTGAFGPLTLTQTASVQMEPSSYGS
jgi:Flp pilus assembly protein TadG